MNKSTGPLGFEPRFLDLFTKSSEVQEDSPLPYEPPDSERGLFVLNVTRKDTNKVAFIRLAPYSALNQTTWRDDLTK